MNRTIHYVSIPKWQYDGMMYQLNHQAKPARIRRIAAIVGVTVGVIIAGLVVLMAFGMVLESSGIGAKPNTCTSRH